jgi:hypothetical protein
MPALILPLLWPVHLVEKRGLFEIHVLLRRGVDLVTAMSIQEYGAKFCRARPEFMEVRGESN